MSRRRGAVRLLAALTLTVAGALAVTTPATADPGPTITDLTAAAARIMAGDGTAADRATVDSAPDLARHVVDPSRTVVTFAQGRTAGLRADGTDGAGIAAGNWAWVRAEYFSTMGFKVYSWRHYVYWQYNGHVITAFPDRSDIIDYTDGTVNFGATTLQGGFTGGYYGYSRMQRHVQHCYVNWGCFGNSYPWGQIDVTAQGLATWHSGIG